MNILPMPLSLPPADDPFPKHKVNLSIIAFSLFFVNTLILFNFVFSLVSSK